MTSRLATYDVDDGTQLLIERQWCLMLDIERLESKAERDPAARSSYLREADRLAEHKQAICAELRRRRVAGY